MKRHLLSCIIGAAMFSVGCASKTETKTESEKYHVTAPLLTDTTVVKEYVSQIRSVRNIELRAQERGLLQDIYVDEGQSVKAGQLLFRIMPKIYEAELMKSQAEAKLADIERINAKTLADKNVISRTELSMAEAKLERANAEVALARTHLSFTEIRAPFDGIIDRLPKKAGSLIDEGELLTTLSDNSRMFAYFNVSEPEYLNYETDAKTRGSAEVNLLLANNQTFNARGKVETIEGEFDNETGNIAFRATFPNPDMLLKHGETGKVLMSIPASGALIIPQKATFEIQEKIYVFVVGKDGIVKSRNITIAHDMPDLYIVSSGLTVNDHILLEGIQKVKDGDKVNAEFVSPAAAVANLKLYAE